MTEITKRHEGSVREVAALFLRMGITAFGGPAAHIAMFRDEVVTRRKWLTDEEFLDLLGATNLIPGPNSTEMAIHVGFLRAGWRGLIAAGVCFILPAALIVGVLAALYAAYGMTPAAHWLLYGIKPVMIAVILQAIYGLLRTAVKTRLMAVTGLLVLILYLLGANEILLLFAAGLIVMLVNNALRLQAELKLNPAGILAMFILAGGTFLALIAERLSRWRTTAEAATTAAVTVTAVSLSTLFLTFLKIGAVLYGSGYVLLAFLRGDFVERLGWLTNQQLLDAVAVGQFTPGPVFTTATFIGYLIAGVPGAILSTIGIFLPSFVFVAATGAIIPYLRRSPWFGALLDGVNVASLALMVAVTLQLGQNAIIDVFTLALTIIAAVLLMRYKVNSTWLIVGGAVAGILYAFLTVR